MDEARGLKQVITKEILPSEGQAKALVRRMQIFKSYACAFQKL